MRIDRGEVLAIVEAHDAPEIARRIDYWNYLRERGGDDGESLEEHVRRYARVIRTGETASDAELAELERFAGRSLPEELRTFYREVGRLDGAAFQIESVRGTLERLRLPEVERFRRLRSVGLVDRIHLCWGGSRLELEAESGQLTREQIAELNRRFVAIGWVTTDPGEEGHTFLHFDEAGRFGSIVFHQDDEEFLETELLPLLGEPGTEQSLGEILMPLLRRHARPESSEKGGESAAEAEAARDGTGEA